MQKVVNESNKTPASFIEKLEASDDTTSANSRKKDFCQWLFVSLINSTRPLFVRVCGSSARTCSTFLSMQNALILKKGELRDETLYTLALRDRPRHFVQQQMQTELKVAGDFLRIFAV